MVIDTVMWFRSVPDWGAVEDVLQERLVAQFPVFRSHAVKKGTSWEWQEVVDFELADQIQRVTLDAPATSRRFGHLLPRSEAFRSRSHGRCGRCTSSRMSTSMTVRVEPQLWRGSTTRLPTGFASPKPSWGCAISIRQTSPRSGARSHIRKDQSRWRLRLQRRRGQISPTSDRQPHIAWRLPLARSETS